MSSDDQALILEFVTESRDHLSLVESQLLQIESNGANFDAELVNEVFRGIHSIKGAAGFLGLVTVNKLGHSLENVLGLIRTRESSPTTSMVEAMLKAADTLSQLVNNVDASNEINVDAHLQALDAIALGEAAELAVEPLSIDLSRPSSEDPVRAVHERKDEPLVPVIVQGGDRRLANRAFASRSASSRA